MISRCDFNEKLAESRRDQEEGGELDSHEEVRRFCGSRRDQELQRGGAWEGATFRKCSRLQADLLFFFILFNFFLLFIITFRLDILPAWMTEQRITYLFIDTRKQ